MEDVTKIRVVIKGVNQNKIYKILQKNNIRATNINKINYKQIELEMCDTKFADYIGLHRTWLANFRNNKSTKHKLSKKTIANIHNRLGIPLEVMERYNENLLEDGEHYVR